MVGDAFLLIVRWLHVIAAAAWVGGGIFYWVVVRPALRAGDSTGLLARFAGPEFGQLVNLCMWTLVITGLVLAFDRLSEETGTVSYAAVLSVKVLLAGWMFLIVQTRRRRGAEGAGKRGWGKVVNALEHVNMTVVLGLIVLVLSDVLRWLVERGLEG